MDLCWTNHKLITINSLKSLDLLSRLGCERCTSLLKLLFNQGSNSKFLINCVVLLMTLILKLLLLDVTYINAWFSTTFSGDKTLASSMNQLVFLNSLLLSSLSYYFCMLYIWYRYGISHFKFISKLTTNNTICIFLLQTTLIHIYFNKFDMQ